MLKFSDSVLRFDILLTIFMDSQNSFDFNRLKCTLSQRNHGETYYKESINRKFEDIGKRRKLLLSDENVIHQP